MKIKSTTKDYYDYIAHLYGGGDPTCLYVRKRLAERTVLFGTSLSGTIGVKQRNITKIPSCDYRYQFRFKWLSICGKYYLLVNNQKIGYKEEWGVYTPEKYPDIAYVIDGRWSAYRAVTDAIGNFSLPLLELSRKIDAPVFTFNCGRGDQITVDGEIPNLGNLGFASIISAQQIYQDLSYFVGNLMKTSPDLAPVSFMTDKEKIIQHGFDFKKSFRHQV